MGKLDGKVALISGASHGQGAAEARLFAAEGAAVALADIDDAPGEALAQEIRASGGRAHYVHLDVCNRAQWADAVQATLRTFGGVHVLVNNAGVVSRGGIMDVGDDEWHRVMEINVTGCLYGMQTAAPIIRNSGGGAIVNISSTAGLLAHPGAAYSASKWALRGLTKVAAMEFVDWGVRVNSIHPAQVADTTIAQNAPASYREVTARVIPMGRGAQSAEIARVVLFLACEDSSYITGAELAVDAGYTAFALPRLRADLIREAKLRD